MSMLAWIALGLISGFIASKLINRTGEGFLLDIVLGIVGAVVGGWLFNTFGMGRVLPVSTSTACWSLSSAQACSWSRTTLFSVVPASRSQGREIRQR